MVLERNPRHTLVSVGFLHLTRGRAASSPILSVGIVGKKNVSNLEDCLPGIQIGLLTYIPVEAVVAVETAGVRTDDNRPLLSR